MQFNWLLELSRNINRGRRRRLLGTSRSRMYCKTHVLELELQGVTWADNGQDCCRLVTRVRNLPINQHDRSCSPGTSETGASSCWWRPRRRQAPDCWLQGLYFLATVWKQTAIVKGQNIRRTNELCVVQNNESKYSNPYSSEQLQDTWLFNTSCTIPANGYFHMGEVCTAIPCFVLDSVTLRVRKWYSA